MKIRNAMQVLNILQDRITLVDFQRWNVVGAVPTRDIRYLDLICGFGVKHVQSAHMWNGNTSLRSKDQDKFAKRSSRAVLGHLEAARETADHVT